MAIMRNDAALLSLGFAAPQSYWYGALKRIEIAARPKKPDTSGQLSFLR